MAKGLTILGMVIAVLIFCLFAVDLAIKMPFERASWPLDATLVICASILGYLSWSAYKEQT
jgi:hypothetical protein